MLKARSRFKDGTEVVLIGLSRLNTERLMKGKPIQIDGKELGIQYTIILMGGEDESAMMEELLAHGVKIPS